MEEISKRLMLSYAIESKDWKKASELLLHESSAALKNYVDNRKGYNVLHLACLSRDTPLEIINTILASSPLSALVEDNRGQTPLAIALRRSADDASLAILQVCPQAAQVEDIEGHTPLHYAVHGEKPIEVIISLIQANPYALTDSLLHAFYNRWNMGLREVFNASKNLNTFANSILDVRVPHRISPRIVRELHQKACVLTKSYDGSTSPSLHSSIRVQSCPWSFCELILKINPEQIYQEDNNGNHAIHIAVSSSYLSTDADFYVCNECKSPFKSKWYQHKRHNHELQSQYCVDCVHGGLEPYLFQEEDYIVVNSVNKIPAIIDSLVTLKPDLASVPNSVGKLPLHQAIESSHNFSSIQALLYASPNALKTRDIQSHLTPFMSSAVERIFEREEDKLDKFSSCFAWLMEDPTLIS